MAQIQCPTCFGSGMLGDRTCISCSGRGSYTVPDPIPKYTQRKPASPAKEKSQSSNGVWSLFKSAPPAKKKPVSPAKEKSQSNNGVWSLFKSAPPVKKKPANINNSKPVKSGSRGAVLPKPATEKIKAFSALIGFIGGFIVFAKSSNIGAALVGGVVIYLLVGATIVIVNNLLDFAAELIKKLAILALWGVIILVIAYALQRG